MTYSELSNYYTFPIHPWLQTALSIVNVQRDGSVTTDSLNKVGLTPDPEYDSNAEDIKSIQQTILNNPEAKEVADKFYRSVLGVGCADPTLIYDFTNGGFSPVARLNGVWIEGPRSSDSSPRNGGEGNLNMTTVGNLKLVSRPVEGRKSIESKFGFKFIDLNPQNYNQDSVMYSNPSTAGTELLEPGASMFLNYEEIDTLLKTVDTNE